MLNSLVVFHPDHWCTNYEFQIRPVKATGKKKDLKFAHYCIRPFMIVYRPFIWCVAYSDCTALPSRDLFVRLGLEHCRTLENPFIKIRLGHGHLVCGRDGVFHTRSGKPSSLLMGFAVDLCLSILSNFYTYNFTHSLFVRQTHKWQLFAYYTCEW